MASPNKKTKRIVIALVTLVLIVLAALFGVGNYLFDYAVGRGGDGGNREVSLEVETTTDPQSEYDLNTAKQDALTQKFVETATEQEVSITSDDNLSLTGFYYPKESHKWALIIHGYRGTHLSMIDYCQRYHDAGYQVIAPDLRGCGKSEGDYIGMGWPDRLDMLNWIDWIIEQDPEAEIILHGVSMGAATTMMTSGEDTPDNVIAFIEDCGYTSEWDIFASELQLRFDLPEFPILNVASCISTIRAGYSFEEASALNQVKKCEKPMLFIHGDADDFVPFEMLQVLYDAKPGTNKDRLVVEGAAHADSYLVLGEAYWNTVFDFIEDVRS
ncbi:MAG: alpha/beta hydrolase [Anaerotardibacter sp.]